MLIHTWMLAFAFPVLAQQAPGSEPAASSEPPAPSAQAGPSGVQPEDRCDGPITDVIADLRVTKSEADYRCLVQRDDAGAALLREIQSTSDADPAQSSVTRALAVHLMPRLGRFLTPDEARALNPADRRLLRDAIHARRGRQSPSPEHDAIFRRFDWYQPDEDFTNARLDHVDRANMKLLDDPPAIPAPEPAMAAMGEGEAADPGHGMCGCSASAPVGGWLGVALLGGVLGWRRRG